MPHVGDDRLGDRVNTIAQILAWLGQAIGCDAPEDDAGEWREVVFVATDGLGAVRDHLHGTVEMAENEP